MTHKSLEITTSKATLKIASLVSTRPRTLTELSDLTGVSIQAVLKHLKRLEKLGYLEERKLANRNLAARIVYSSAKARVSDFSTEDLIIVNRMENLDLGETPDSPIDRIEFLAEESIIQRSRVREEVRKLGRMMTQFGENEGLLGSILNSLNLEELDWLTLFVFFTETSREESIRVLSKYYGIKEGGKSIDRALGRAKRIGR